MIRSCSVVMVAMVATVLALLWAGTARAHESRPAYLELQQVAPDTYELMWKVPGRAADERLALDVHLSEGCELLSAPRRSYAQGAFVERNLVRREGGLAGATLYIEGLSLTLTDVLVRIEHHSGHVQLARLTPDAPALTVTAAPSTGEVASTYFVLGVEHILEGFDHLVFVACLLLLTGVGRALLVTITGFTVAHSITLALASVDIVRVPVPPVEAVIALSIGFVAHELAQTDAHGLTHRYPVAVSSSFGLLHGFGFAAVLRQIGLPPTDVPTSLLFFNLGVEAGQLLFIGALVVGLAAARWLAKPPRRERLRRPAAYVFGTLAAFWVIERVVGFWSG